MPVKITNKKSPVKPKQKQKKSASTSSRKKIPTPKRRTPAKRKAAVKKSESKVTGKDVIKSDLPKLNLDKLYEYEEKQCQTEKPFLPPSLTSRFSFYLGAFIGAVVVNILIFAVVTIISL